MRAKIVGVALLLVTATGCLSTRLADLTIVSTQNVDFSKLTPEVISSAKEVEGVALPWYGGGDMEDAIEDALKKGGGNVLMDAVIYREVRSYVLWGRTGYRVKGRVLKAR
jgi:hypothetical protein